MTWLILAAQLALTDIDAAKTGPLADTWIVPAELDGNPSTREWVAWDTAGPFASHYRAIDVRPDGSLCVGSYVWPWPKEGVWYGYVGRAGDRDRLLIQSAGRYLEVTLTPCREQATAPAPDPEP